MIRVPYLTGDLIHTKAANCALDAISRSAWFSTPFWLEFECYWIRRVVRDQYNIGCVEVDGVVPPRERSVGRGKRIIKCYQHIAVNAYRAKMRRIATSKECSDELLLEPCQIDGVCSLAGIVLCYSYDGMTLVI